MRIAYERGTEMKQREKEVKGEERGSKRTVME